MTRIGRCKLCPFLSRERRLHERYPILLILGQDMSIDAKFGAVWIFAETELLVLL
ncbi:uncharacterized protein BDV14DRAFT_166928 [Aspergillus stella-maris]|uniref:uncharacterized protein n=1 Tax=Aspergillus stella-maris TaxID=1810926 RepID=UPI003CCD2A8F